MKKKDKRKMTGSKLGISILIPCYNEAVSVEETVKKTIRSLLNIGINFEVHVINDASSDDTSEILGKMDKKELIVTSNPFRMGYGACLKIGIKKSKFDWIGICDADGTYPVEMFPEFLEHIKDNDMIIGIRKGKTRAIPWTRLPAKWFLNKFSSFVVKRKILDVNSGMRVFKKEAALKYWNLLPDGFSFTTTITLSMVMDHYRIKNLNIEYLKRKGKSKINPFKDTYDFFILILKIAMLYNPLRVFMPAFFTVMFMTIFSLGRDIYNLNLTDTTVMLFIFSMIILMIGLLADLINKKIPSSQEK